MRGVHELWEWIKIELEAFDIGICCKYIEIMSARVQAVIRAKDGNAMFSFFYSSSWNFFNCYLFRMTII